MSFEFLLNTKKNILDELSSWSRFELVFALVAILIVFLPPLYMKDSPVAIISAVCGIMYTILAGKGKVYCYFFGIIGTLCCAYLSYEIALYGNFMLHFLYYFPMEVIGFFSWKKHIDKTKNEIIKDKLTPNQLVMMILAVTIATFVTYLYFLQIDDKSPFIDAFMTVLSIAGMILTVRRSIEQWLIWTMVNFLSIIMWFNAFVEGERIFSIFLVRIIYFILGIYFFIKWKNSTPDNKIEVKKEC